MTVYNMTAAVRGWKEKTQAWGIEIAYDSNLSLSSLEMPLRSIIYETKSFFGDWEVW
jgi:hypothetical protein